MRVELSQVDEGCGWFIVCVSADDRIMVGRCGRGRARCRRDERMALHADLFDFLEISVSIATSLVCVVEPAARFLAIVAVFQ